LDLLDLRLANVRISKYIGNFWWRRICCETSVSEERKEYWLWM